MDLAMFDAVASAKATQGGVWIRDGRGRMIIDHLELEPKTNGKFFIAEFVVEKSEKVLVVSLLSGQKLDIDPNPTGSRCSMSIPIDSPKIKSGPGNVKSFVLALLGYNDGEVSNADFSKALAQLVDRDHTTGEKLSKPLKPARGMVIDYETYRKKTREAPVKELVLPKWFHVAPGPGGNDKKDIAARRATLDGAQK